MEAKRVLEEKRVNKKVKAVNDIVNLNVTAWLNKEEATEKFSVLDDNLKQEVIEAQLSFYRDVLLCERKTPRVMFTKSEGGKKLGFQRLFEKLLEAIEYISTGDDNVMPTKTVLKPRAEREELYNKQKDKLKTRIFNDRLAVAVKRKNVLDIPKIYSDPAILVNCSIQHKLKEDSVEVWLQGEVTGIERVDQRNPHLTTYIIKYSGDPDNYTCRLIKDMEKGDCFVQIAPWK